MKIEAVNQGLRIRGRAAVRLRKARLLREPLCRLCKEVGIVRASTVPDHIIPLSQGGNESPENIQCLCEQCHARKTAYEDASREGALTHPDWLKPSAIPLEIVCGPPCSGKTTYVKERAARIDTVIDYDDIAKTVCKDYEPWGGAIEIKTWRKIIRIRNHLLGSLRLAAYGHAWFIVSAPSQAERCWWRDKLGGKIAFMDVPAAICKERAIKRGTPKAVQGIDEWCAKSRCSWSPPVRKRIIGADGWPVDS